MPKVYTAPILPRLLVTLGIGFVIVMVLFTWLPQELPRSIGGYNQRKFLALALGLVGAGLLAMLMLWWQHLSLVVTHEALELRRAGRTIKHFDRATTRFGTRITEQRSYGMKVGAVRTLLALPAGATKPVELTLPGLSKEKFNELYAILAPLDVAPVVPAPVAPTTRAPWDPPVPALPLAAMPPTAAVPPVVASGVTPVQSRTFAPQRDWAGGSGRRIPQRIDVSAGLLVVDGEGFPFGALRSITLTPPGYDKRTLALVTADGGKRAWPLGGSGGDSQTPWANYDGLIDAVRTAAQGYPGLVTFDLG